jgi:hypothetical protein
MEQVIVSMSTRATLTKSSEAYTMLGEGEGGLGTTLHFRSHPLG